MNGSCSPGMRLKGIFETGCNNEPIKRRIYARNRCNDFVNYCSPLNFSCMDARFKTKIKVPELVTDEVAVGKNKIVQLAQGKEVVEVDVIQESGGLFTLTDQVGRVFSLKLASSKSECAAGNILRAVTLKDISQLNESTSLKWENHVLNSKKLPAEIVDSWRSVFSFTEEIEGKQFGLRRPQLGAIHAISAHWSVKNTCATLVMPTGTGKTETMISAMVHEGCGKILVLVPSDTLRTQLYKKFLTLGCLKSIGVLDEDTRNPRVALIKHGIESAAEINQIIRESNVIVSTVQALIKFPEEVLNKLTEGCTHLFIDEAHHAPAKSWKKIKGLFRDKLILQFTATPFRRDGKRIEGDIIYNYPLGMAQQDKYFKSISLVKIQEFDDKKADAEIARQAIQTLESDLSAGHDHILMARCKDKDRADEVFKIYQTLGAAHDPVLMYSNIGERKNKQAIEKLESKKSRIIVCVDMLGEGYDFPNLKIAALHDIHKSLAVTLQFVGRFVRTSSNVGDASVVVNISDPKVSKKLEDLYSDGADWDQLLKQKSEATIQSEIDFSKFIDSFKGELSKHISLWNLRPAYSAIIYKTECESWTPRAFTEAIPERYKHWSAINEEEKILVLVISTEDEVNWGKYKDIKNYNFELCVIHWDETRKALFVQSSNYDAVSSHQLAKLICGDTVSVKNGSKVFNIYSGIERVLARNVGMSTAGNISYTMHFGTDITSGLSKLERATATLSNIFGWGYEDGERVAKGCSARKGKIWSVGGGTIKDWQNWCYKIADKIFDDTIDESEVVKDFLKPQKLTGRYPAASLLVQWSENILKMDEDKVSLFFGKNERRLIDVDLEILGPSDSGPITFRIFSDDHESVYQISYEAAGCKYALVSGDPLQIKKYNGDPVSLLEYLETDPVTIIYTDGSFSFNDFHVPTPPLDSFFDVEKIICPDWTGVNIQAESIGKDGNDESVQKRIADLVKDDYEIVFNDDASGEAADLICIRQESNDTLKLHLIHCKASKAPTVGCRVEDMYVLCGQAQKCIRWKHNGMDYLAAHMKRREDKWQEDENTRFIKGDMSEVNRLKKFARVSKIIFNVSIVQPGLSKKLITDDVIQLVGNTEDYLVKTAGANFDLYCSE